MARRSFAFTWLLLLASVGSSWGASARSKNFVVEAPTEQLAKEFAELAEYYRREKAIEWLGKQMPDWTAPCTLKITITDKGAGGATQFEFGGQSIRQSMHIEGAYERLKNSVLPHEVTHTVFAHHFRQPVPRWADEGGSVYSEDDLERGRHDGMCKQILNGGRGFPLKRLFSLSQYPNDVMVLYAQGYSVTRFLVESSDRQTFLNFVADGMNLGWDRAVQTHYKYRSVDALEEAWLNHLRKTGGKSSVAKEKEAPSALASTTKDSEATAKLTIRQSAWPVRPDLDPPVTTRGLAPSGTDRNRGETANATGWNYPPAKLSEPEPISKQTSISTERSNESMTPQLAKNKPAPPPVVLFPPEPLR